MLTRRLDSWKMMGDLGQGMESMYVRACVCMCSGMGWEEKLGCRLMDIQIHIGVSYKKNSWDLQILNSMREGLF